MGHLERRVLPATTQGPAKGRKIVTTTILVVSCYCPTIPLCMRAIYTRRRPEEVDNPNCLCCSYVCLVCVFCVDGNTVDGRSERVGASGDEVAAIPIYSYSHPLILLIHKILRGGSTPGLVGGELLERIQQVY